jgi:cellulose synthase/poly-beta-1,6-N-acetylglucosamine synthase-like glycosyltransferase
MDIVEIANYFIAFLSVYVVVFYFILLFTYRKNYDEEPPIDEDWTPYVSIIVPAYNEEKYISKCLEMLLNIDYPKERLEIIVINDGSTDNTEKEARKFEKYGVKVYTQKNAGKGAALNHGLRIARGEFIVTMDADSYVTPGTLRQLLAFFKEDEKVMAVTPAIKIRPSKNLLVELQRIEYLMIIFSRKLLSFIDAVPVTPGPFSVFRASVFKEVGGFDENNLVEDQEIALRIQKHNYKIKSSVKAEVYTEPPDNLNDLLKQRIRWQRGGIRNYWKYKHMITPEYGDFGLFFIPLNFITLAAFFVVLGLMINAIINAPYYGQYILLESIISLGVTPVTIPLFFAGLASVAWLVLVLSNFKNEKVGIVPIVLYYFFYWYLMLGYNLGLVYKELKQEKFSW